MYLASGVADLPTQQHAGVNVALGADGSASNNNQDMISVMKITSLLQKVVRRDASLYPASEVLRMATRNGYRSTGVRGGAIEVGSRADLIVMDLGGLHNQPLHDPISAVVYSAHATDVETVIVDGQVVMRHRDFRDVDADRVVHEANTRANALLSRIQI
jgi:5-methylthioadenosine/S-adenosylhomocysteine deaminase